MLLTRHFLRARIGGGWIQYKDVEKATIHRHKIFAIIPTELFPLSRHLHFNLFHFLRYSKKVERVSDIEKCCREKGLIDHCFGYCKWGLTKTVPRSQQTGICVKWFSTIEKWRKGI